MNRHLGNSAQKNIKSNELLLMRKEIKLMFF
jgi:hypothetical protein